MSGQIYNVTFQEDGTVTVLARITARDGSGSATGVNGEGNWLQQADVSTITCAVFDLSTSTPDTAIATPTVTVGSAVLDTPVTATTLWTRDTTGYNFLHDLAPASFPTGGHTYLVEYRITTSGGAVAWLKVRGTAIPNLTS